VKRYGQYTREINGMNLPDLLEKRFDARRATVSGASPINPKKHCAIRAVAMTRPGKRSKKIYLHVRYL
jgi:hypothetical protein